MKDPTLFAVVHAGIWEHRKLRRLARRLVLPDVYVVGHLTSLWTAMVNQCPEGVLRDWDSLDIAEAARWPGEPDAFVRALREEGWLIETPEGFACEGWRDYAGRGLYERAAAAARQRRKRARDADADGGENDPPETSGHGYVPVTDAQSHAEITDEREREREREREQNKRGRGSAAAPPEPSPESVKSAAPPKHSVTPARPPETARQAPIDPPPWEEEPPALTEAEKADAREGRAVVRQAMRDLRAPWAKADAVNGRPQSVDELLALRVVREPDGRVHRAGDTQEAITLAQLWAADCKPLDGRGAPRRPTVAEIVARVWESSTAKRNWSLDGTAYIAWWAGILASEAGKVRFAWEKDGGGVQGTHPLWSTWRKMKDDGVDVAPFEEWLIKREEAKPRTSGSPSPSASTPPKQSTPAPPSTSPSPSPSPSPAVSDEEAAAARARFLSLAKPIGAKPAPPPKRAAITPDRPTLNRMLEQELDGADT